MKKLWLAALVAFPVPGLAREGQRVFIEPSAAADIRERAAGHADARSAAAAYLDEIKQNGGIMRLGFASPAEARAATLGEALEGYVAPLGNWAEYKGPATVLLRPMERKYFRVLSGGEARALIVTFPAGSRWLAGSAYAESGYLGGGDLAMTRLAGALRRIPAAFEGAGVLSSCYFRGVVRRRDRRPLSSDPSGELEIAEVGDGAALSWRPANEIFKDHAGRAKRDWADWQAGRGSSCR